MMMISDADRDSVNKKGNDKKVAKETLQLVHSGTWVTMKRICMKPDQFDYEAILHETDCFSFFPSKPNEWERELESS